MLFSAYIKYDPQQLLDQYTVLLLRLFIATLFPLLELKDCTSFSLALFLCLYFGLCHFVHAEASWLSFYPVPFCSWALGKRSKRPVCTSALPYPPCKYGNSLDTTSHWSQSCNLSMSISFASVAGTSAFPRNGTFAARSLSSLCIF